MTSAAWSVHAPGWIVVSSAAAQRHGPGPCILSPVLAGLGTGLCDIAAALPVGDANALLLAELDRAGPASGHVVAGVLANDPFRQHERLLRALRERGVRAVANWPSLGLISGELSQALTHSGFTFEAELDLLRTAHINGFATAAFVCGREQAERAIAVEPSMIVVAPPLSAAKDEDQRAAAQEAASLYAALSARGQASELWLYVPERLSGELGRDELAGAQVIRLAPTPADQASL